MRISSLAIVLLVVVVGAISGCKPLAKDTYQTCFGSADCTAAGDSCVQVMSTSSDRMCTHSCVAGTDCPTSRDGTAFGVCLPVSSGGTFCYSHCSFDSDCPSGWICNTGTTRGAACTPR